jgi:hypothetical protein
MLDYKELPEDGQAFEQLVREILFNKGLYVQWSGRGADGGKDLICRETLRGLIAPYSKTWLVQCKHFAHSGRSVGLKDLDSIADSCAQHQATGYLLACSTQPSSGVVQRLESITADPANPLTAVCWDGVTVERLLSNPRDWGIAQRFMPASSGEWKLYATERPNDFVAHYKGYVFHLTNRVGSEAGHHLPSIKSRIEELESIKLQKGHFIRPRAVWHDDKNGGYTWYVDYMYPNRDSSGITKTWLADILHDGWALDDGQIYSWDIKFVEYNAFSDHYDDDHYDYYVKYTENFLSGSSRSEVDYTEYFATFQEIEQLKEDLNEVRVKSFDAMIEAFKRLPFLRVMRGINVCVENVHRFERRYSWSDIVNDIGVNPSYLFDAKVIFSVDDEKEFHKLLSILPIGMDKHFRVARVYVYMPDLGLSDEVIYDLTLSLHPADMTNQATIRREFNKYFEEISATVGAFEGP